VVRAPRRSTGAHPRQRPRRGEIIDLDDRLGSEGSCVTMARSARLQLRSCPLCGSGWVAHSERELLEQPHVFVALRCGSCGTWRRILTNHWVADAFERGQMKRTIRVLRAAFERDLVDAIDFAPRYARADS
jgi:hypothetical protein